MADRQKKIAAAAVSGIHVLACPCPRHVAEEQNLGR